MNQLIEQVSAWGISRGITGPEGKGTLLGQLSKSQEELTETRDAAIKWSVAMGNGNSLTYQTAMREQLKDGIGDTVVTLILAADIAGLSIQDCLQHAYDVIIQRTGVMSNGQFVKDK